MVSGSIPVLPILTQLQFQHRSPAVRSLAIQIIGKKAVTNPETCLKVLSFWKDKNGRIHRELINVIGMKETLIHCFLTVLHFVCCHNYKPTILGNFGKVPQNLLTLLDPNVLKYLDDNSTHVWNTLSYYWQTPVCGTGLNSNSFYS